MKTIMDYFRKFLNYSKEVKVEEVPAKTEEPKKVVVSPGIWPATPPTLEVNVSDEVKITEQVN